MSPPPVILSLLAPNVAPWNSRERPTRTDPTPVNEMWNPVRATVLTLSTLLSIVAGSILIAASPSPTESSVNESSDASSEKRATAILAGGCFWCTEAVYEEIEGVHDVVSGYIGGPANYAVYDKVKYGQTGHAEAVKITYDPDKLSFDEVLEIFFKTHDPTTLNQQGADRGPQYRSSVFYVNDEQKEAAKKYIAKLEEKGTFRSPIVTKLESGLDDGPMSKFYPAEEYHQDYFRKNPYAGYCQAVVSKKVRKTKNLFKDKLKVNR